MMNVPELVVCYVSVNGIGTSLHKISIKTFWTLIDRGQSTGDDQAFDKK